MAIYYNTARGRYEIDRDSRDFESFTRRTAEGYARFLGTWTTGASPQDVNAAGGTAGMDLCHHLSHGDIESAVRDYLNGDISLNQFLILVGSVMRPSWSNILFPPTLLLLAVQWAVAAQQRIAVVARGQFGGHQARADAANNLVHTLNNAITNLRYGHRSTNRSIQGHFDLRLHRGVSLDPFTVVVLLVGRATGREVYAGESSALLNDWESFARCGIPRTPAGGVKMSESNNVITRTRTTNRPVMGSAREPIQDGWTRGSFRLWLPVSADSLVYILGAFLLIYVFGLPTSE